MAADNTSILGHLGALSDATRSRLLLLLDRRDLTVSELCGIVQLPQSTVSRHLKALSDTGWVSARTVGASNVYTMVRNGIEAPRRRLWLLVREQVGSTSAARQDERRLSSALAARRRGSQEFFSSSAGQWDRLRDDLFGDFFHLAALAALAQPDWTVGDLGCGTGPLGAALAPFVSQVIAVDGSAAMLRAARRRLQAFDNVELRRGELEALPIDGAQLDAAALMLVLHHVPEPAKAIGEAARVLKPGGRILLVDMFPHDREQYRHQMGHMWLGFSEAHVRHLLSDGGFDDVRIIALPPDARAKGPALFVASGHRHAPPRARERTRRE
jgi:ArsR family transcriptional regulator